MSADVGIMVTASAETGTKCSTGTCAGVNATPGVAAPKADCDCKPRGAGTDARLTEDGGRKELKMSELVVQALAEEDGAEITVGGSGTLTDDPVGGTEVDSCGAGGSEGHSCSEDKGGPLVSGSS